MGNMKVKQLNVKHKFRQLKYVVYKNDNEIIRNKHNSHMS